MGNHSFIEFTCLVPMTSRFEFLGKHLPGGQTKVEDVLGSENSFEKQSFRNLVIYYERELRRILRGVSVSKILSPYDSRRLTRRGVLILKGRGTHIQYSVSRKACDILEEMEWIMPQTRIYVLNRRTFSSMKARYGDEFACSWCGREFQLYDLVVSKPSRSKSRVKWYHSKCLDSLYLWI